MQVGGGLGAIPDSRREFRPSPILPSVVQVLPGIPVSIWDGFSHRFLGGIPEVQPKIHPGPVWFNFDFSFSFSPWASSRNSRGIQGAEFQALFQLWEFFFLGGKCWEFSLGEIINIYNLEIYILKKKKGEKIQEKSDLFS